MERGAAETGASGSVKGNAAEEPSNDPHEEIVMKGVQKAYRLLVESYPYRVIFFQMFFHKAENLESLMTLSSLETMVDKALLDEIDVQRLQDGQKANISKNIVKKLCEEMPWVKEFFRLQNKMETLPPKPAAIIESKFFLPPGMTYLLGDIRQAKGISIHTEMVVINIDNQNTLSSATYSMFETIFQRSTPLPMTRDEFIRMWKTLILKRVQDVLYETYCQPSEHYSDILSEYVTVPAPLADLLYNLGSISSTMNGVRYCPVAPEKGDEDWWSVDPDIVLKWARLMGLAKQRYTVMPFPRLSNFDCKEKPLILTVKQTIDVQETKAIQIRSVTSEPKPRDVLIQLYNDPLSNIGTTTPANVILLTCMEQETMSEYLWYYRDDRYPYYY